MNSDSGPKRPQRRPKKRPSNMSFRKLPPLPQNSEVFVTNHSQIVLNEAENSEKLVKHRKWVKLRTLYSDENFLSASGVRFRFHCDADLQNNGCEVQEVSAFIEDYDFLGIFEFSRSFYSGFEAFFHSNF